MSDTLQALFKYIDENQKTFIDNLRDAVAIKSVSAWPHTRDDVVKMVTHVGETLKNLGAKVELRDIGTEKLPNGSTIPLPPVLLGSLGDDKNKQTILLYGHLDVQPALVEDGWDTNPFELTEKNGKLYGRGSSDDKGPVLGWVHAIQTYQALKISLPVNLKFCFEGMEESGSQGLDALLWSEKDKFLANTDHVCISDTYWLGTEKPCIGYGLRGICYFFLEVECAKKDLHSGIYGGTVHEAMTDLIYLLNTLVDRDGKILIDGIYNEVAPLIENETDIYDKIHFSVDEFRSDVGADKLLHSEDKVKLLMHRWRHPCLSIHGIEGAFSDPGSKTVIPCKVTGKFSIRIVANQEPKKIEKYVVDYIEKKWKEYGSPNKMKIFMREGGKTFIEDPNNQFYVAARNAMKHVFNVEPDLIREGGSIPVTLTLSEVTGKTVVLLPMGAGDDGAHSQNEKLNIRNYIEGTKVMATYFHEVGKLPK
ncbi:cytosolic non-specific dipeptidase isoform X1 [Chrysoperla carnea]|uniref:cytosolic non-specific dipeptidase isoform X1 n=1 Tax=Chrysoperla carnea TaxID=189513 RepID=UPI001D0933BA|nr:cytosolic non-specific dipeptidase isoform X1 [Chrysoperla carnea]XP_044734562.1 cytosolic non-specific dipeptidase isoform X1 [Chrysoperla carnea]